MAVHVGLLGPFALSGRDGAIEISGHRQRSLAAILALECGRTVSSDRLIEALWPDDDVDDPLNALQHHVSRLRAAVGREIVMRHDDGYALDLTADHVDALYFERLMARGNDELRNGAVAEARSTLRQALDLWRGPALQGFEGDHWAIPEAQRLERLRLDGLEDRIEADMNAGLHREVVDELETLARQHPFRERLWGQLMLALYRSGRQSDALVAYQELRKLVAEEKGLDPGPELQRLEVAIISQAPSLEAGGTLAGATRASVPGNLVSPLTRFIGRHELLQQIRRSIGEHRLVTLLGPGGTGKTRLAVESGLASGGEFADGAWFVDLAPISDPGDVPAAISSVLEARSAGGGTGPRPARGEDPTTRAIASLRDRHLLLIVDNCEHLITAVSRIVETALAASPPLHVLATSREPLGIPGEVRRAVPPLSVPARGPDDPEEIVSSEAVRLFEDRATRILPDFALTEETARDVADLCRHLDGLPLAIELAAAWVGTLPVRRIAEELDERFRLLVSPSRNSVDRHASLRATIDWSYDLLAPDERELFEALSVFAGAASLSAVEWLGSEAGRDQVETLDLLQRLIDRSLLVADTLARDEPRYAMLESLQAYGRERLVDRGGLTDALRTQRRFFVDLAERGDGELVGARYLEWQRRLQVEYPNLRSVFDAALADGDGEAALRIAGSLWQLWAITDRHGEGRRWLAEAVAAGGDAPAELRARALAELCYLAGQDRDLSAAIRAGEAAIELAESVGSSWALGWAKQAMALILVDEGDLERGGRLVAEARALLDETDDAWRLAALDLIASHEAIRSGDLEAAAQASGAVLERARRIGYEPYVCWAHLLLGVVAERSSRLDEAATSMQAALELARGLSLPHYVSLAESLLGDVTARRRDARAARRLFQDALDVAEAAGAPWFAALARIRLASLFEMEGEDGPARALYSDVVRWGDASERGPSRESFFITIAGDPYADALIGLGAHELRDDVQQGVRHMRRGVEEATAEHDHAAIAFALERFADEAFSALGADAAAALIGAANERRTAFAYPRSPLEERAAERVLDRARDTLTSAAFHAALERGRAVSIEEAFELLDRVFPRTLS